MCADRIDCKCIEALVFVHTALGLVDLAARPGVIESESWRVVLPQVRELLRRVAVALRGVAGAAAHEVCPVVVRS
jgi:hypothetical protein